jgi:dTDP-4-dehydrorhamnose reductase
MRKILLLGKNGQVGWELHRSLSYLGDVEALDSPELNFTNLDLLRAQVMQYRPDVIVNAVAYTAVDQAESEPDVTHQVNAAAPQALAEFCQELGAVLVHYSTDFVYDGTKSTPYVEKDAANPLNIYAQSKLDGDNAIESVGGAYFILRSSWIYSHRRDNFVKKVLYWAHNRTELSIVTDQIGCPTWARSLAEVTAQLLALGGKDLFDWATIKRGVYHVAASGYTSRYDWAEEILRLDPRRSEQTIRAMKPALSTDFPTPATRPLFSALDNSCFYTAFGLRIPDWRSMLHLMMEEF